MRQFTRVVGQLMPMLLALSATACSVLDSSDPLLTIGLVTRDGYAQPAELQVSVEGRTFALAEPGTLDGEAPREGDLPVTVLLISGTDTLVSDAFQQSFRSDYEHWIQVWVGGSYPIGFCLGEVRGYAIGGTPVDSAFVMFGSIPRGAVC